MDTPFHSLTSLFNQLGLDSSETAIEAFIAKNRPLEGHITLCQADFWSASQASFLAQGIAEDADWAEVIDHLDALLR